MSEGAGAASLAAVMENKDRFEGRKTGLIVSGGNIVEVYHQRLFYDVPVKQAEVDVVVETVDASHVSEIMEKLETAGFPVRLLGGTSLTDES